MQNYTNNELTPKLYNHTILYKRIQTYTTCTTCTQLYNNTHDYTTYINSTKHATHSDIQSVHTYTHLHTEL